MNRPALTWLLASTLSVALVACNHCGAMKRPHTVCQECGTYRGREIIEVSDL